MEEQPYTDARMNVAVESVIRCAGQALEDGNLNYIGGGFAELIDAAAPSMPPTGFSLADMPALYGLVVYGRPLHGVQWLVLWSTMVVKDKGPIGAIVFPFMDGASYQRYQTTQSMADPIYCEDGTVPAFVPFGTVFMPWQVAPPEDCYFPDPEQVDLDDPEMWRWFPGVVSVRLVATWNLMRQRLVVERTEHPDRAARRRLDRAGVADTADARTVRVISLRNPDPESRPVTGTSREYHHRWINRGHWRQQWYPSIKDHRPVWIAPYVKGPADAPLLGAERVYSWNR